jgi:glycosyltransferase involved in cell wall biosynthesis
VLAVEFSIKVEIIAIDDCSKDGPWDMLQEFAQRNPRSKVFRQERNHGKGRDSSRHKAPDRRRGWHPHRSVALP